MSRIDDRDSAVSYSKPLSGHHWTNQGSSTSYSNTLSLTNTRNANATISFTGTSISVYGLISPSGTGNIPSSSYRVDDGPSFTYTANPNQETQSQVLFYQSPTLDNGPHKLVVVNLVERDFLWLDYFQVSVAEAAASSPASTSVRNDPPPATTTRGGSSGENTVPAQSIQTTKVQVVTEIITSIITDSSTTRLAVSTEVQTTTSVGFVVPLTTPEGPVTASGTGSAEEGDKKAPLGAIVGGVVGGLIVIILALVLFLMWKRKQQKDKLAIPDMASIENLAAATSSTPEAMSGTRAVPFTSPPSSNIRTGIPSPAVTSIGDFSGNSLQPSVDNSSGYESSHQRPSYNKHPLSFGNSRHSYGLIPLASEPMGKRQYTIGSSASLAQSSTPLLGGRTNGSAIPSDSGTTASAYSEPRSYQSLHPGDTDLPPPSYDESDGNNRLGQEILINLASQRKS